jgi:uncharacterized protein (TIGR03083 family)
MFDQASATAATERDLGVLIDRLDSLPDDDWNAPVRCQGWQVSDLAAHVTGAARGQAEALRRAVAGQTGLAVLDPPGERDPRRLVAALKDGRDRLLSALRDLPQHALNGTVPLPFGLLPATVALQIVPLEYGFHRNDLDWALGSEIPLGQDMAAALLAIAPGLLPMLAAGTPVSPPGPPPAGPVTFRLLAPAARLQAAYADGAWSITPDPGDSPGGCQISGDNSAVALFIMGRIGAGHPSISVTDHAAATAFKHYFPGP